MIADADLQSGKKLPLMELFYSIQGEGRNTGKAACFIRIGGCDVGCKWCDVKESWNPDIHPLTASDEIVRQVLSFPAKSVVVTGGEPMLYNMHYLTEELHKQGVKLFLETSGAYEFSGVWDWICISPKQKNAIIKENYKKANEIKVIISDSTDFKWAEEIALLVSEGCHLLLQPEWSKRHEVTALIIDYVLRYPQWKISIQTHKFLNIP